MQLMIDTAECTPAQLRMYADTICFLAMKLESSKSQVTTTDMGTATLRPVAPVPAGTLPVVHAAPAPPASPAVEQFRAQTNVVPFPPPQMSVPSAAVPTVAAGPTSSNPPIPPTVNNPPAFDSAGLPWDERIHSSSRETRNDGTWRQRRGVDPALVANVTAELIARRNAGGQAPAAAALPPSPPAPPAAPVEPVAAASPVPLPPLQYPGANTVPMPPAAVGVPQPIGSFPTGQPSVPMPPAAQSALGTVPTGPAASTAEDFSPLLAKFARLQQERGWQHDVLIKACAAAGSKNPDGTGSVNGLIERPNLINIVSMTLDDAAAGRIQL